MELQETSQEYGIEPNKATELLGDLPEIVKQREAIRPQYDAAIMLDMQDASSAKEAARVRKLIQKNRTQGINKWHKAAKDFFLKGGQFVDAIKRKEVAANERMEADLLEIEKYAENREAERIAALQAEREKQLSPYVENAHEIALSEMADDVWAAYLSTKKADHEARLEAEKQAEINRIAKEQEAEKLRAELKAERAKAEAEQATARAEREKAEREQAKLRAEILAKERAEAEQAAQAEAERQAKLSAGDEDKAAALLAELKELRAKYTFTSDKHKVMYADVYHHLSQAISSINL
ncbi:hypothetical protein N9936_01315 [bacterium]|nr:hypothetical protein [bacterium]